MGGKRSALLKAIGEILRGGYLEAGNKRRHKNSELFKGFHNKTFKGRMNEIIKAVRMGQGKDSMGAREAPRGELIR